jgi:hypothetical protein
MRATVNGGEAPMSPVTAVTDFVAKKVIPATAVKDTAYADRIIVPGFGQGGAVVYQVRQGVLRLKTVLEWKE